MKFATFDIETIPCQTLDEDIKSDFAATIKTGNLGDEKTQEKIDKKMALDYDMCEVVCFVAKGDKLCIADGEPIGIVKTAWREIRFAYLAHIPLVSFNGIGFDLPVLLHSAMRLNIPVSPQMYADLTKKWDNRYHYDLQQILAHWDKSKWRTLNFYLKLFGIGEKVGKGSQIYGWYKNQEYDKIREHCEADCRLTSKLFERVMDWIVIEDRYDDVSFKEV